MVESSATLTDPLSELKDIVRYGIAKDLFHLEEALSLNDFISNHSDSINKATFGSFFASLQIILNRFLVLQAARLFEPSHSRHKIRSVYTALSILDTNSDTIAIQQRPGMLRSLARLGIDTEQLSTVNDANITRLVVNHFRSILSNDSQEDNSLFHSIKSIRTLRNKQIAHPEVIATGSLPSTTYEELSKLVIMAKQFLGVVGWGYLSTAYEAEDGRHLLTTDSKRSTFCLRRLLIKADVLTKLESE